MKILSLDQALHLGYCYSNNGKRMKYGMEDFSKIKGDYNEKIHNIKLFVKKLLKQYNPDLVTLEGIFAKNKDTHAKLAGLQAVLIELMIENKIRYEIISPITWKSKVGAGKLKREESKKKTIEFVNKEFGLEITNEDIADAIAMAYYANKFLKE